LEKKLEVSCAVCPGWRHVLKLIRIPRPVFRTSFWTGPRREEAQKKKPERPFAKGIRRRKTK